MNKPTRTLHLPIFVSLAVCALLAAGCASSKPASASFASVVIKGKTPEQICQTTGQVFQDDEYRVLLLGPDDMRFEKEGSRMQSLAYNGVVGTHEGAGIAIRVKAELVDLGMGSYRLQCQAYMVRNAGDSFFQEENRLSNARSGPYQSLLNKVAKRLK
jgi:hypothetical protein